MNVSPVELATLVTAIATALVSLIGAGVSAYTAIRSTQTHALVNGQSEELRQMREARGYAAGVADERASSDVTTK